MVNADKVKTDEFVNFPWNFIFGSHYTVRYLLLRGIKKYLPELKGVLLDVGCGQIPYKKLILNNKEVKKYIGLDLKTSPVYNTSIADIHWDGKIIPLPDNSIDSVLCTEVFEHCSDIETTLREINRILKKGGVLLFTIPFLWPLHEVPNDEYRYTPFAIKRHLINSGFQNIILEALGGWDASMAQMFALWVNQGKRIKTLLLRPILPVVVQILLWLDKTKIVQFTDHTMITGIIGLAKK